jgi:hypothetical protein
MEKYLKILLDDWIIAKPSLREIAFP